jgi:septum formation protein
LVNTLCFARINDEMKKIILASSSPRRKELLDQIGLKFEVVPSNHVEDTSSRQNPHELARLISRNKALAVANSYKNAIIIAADTFIIFHGSILGKPHTEGDAREMLKKLSGRTHSVITGFTIIDTDSNKTVSKSVKTKVHIKKLSSREIDTYVKSKEPLDKAGAYAIQGLGAVIIDKIEGDYFNVMGLPLCALTQCLQDFGIDVL